MLHARAAGADCDQRVRFPKGLPGRDIDALARFNLWVAGQDYDHGTGAWRGGIPVGARGAATDLAGIRGAAGAGMILSNEPGYYREGAFGIRLENLIVVEPAPPLGDNRAQLSFETLTFVPFDRRLILGDELSPQIVPGLTDIMPRCWEKLVDRVSGATLDWLRRACAPL